MEVAVVFQVEFVERGEVAVWVVAKSMDTKCSYENQKRRDFL